MIALAPRSIAFDTATVMPRSLNDAVGLSPSYFSQISNPLPIVASRRWARTSGVLPSLSKTTGVFSVTVRNFRYCSMTPRQALMSFALGQGAHAEVVLNIKRFAFAHNDVLESHLASAVACRQAVRMLAEHHERVRSRRSIGEREFAAVVGERVRELELLCQLRVPTGCLLRDRFIRRAARCCRQRRNLRSRHQPHLSARVD